MKKIFISYGRDEYKEVPLFTEKSLIERGYDVFIDKQLKDGQNFDSRLEKEINECDTVILFMTPHSVRESSVCRDEIAYARNKEKSIIPVMLQRCDAPLLVSRIQWLICNSFDPTSKTILDVQFQEFLKKLIKAIEEPETLNTDGSILTQLNPVNLDVEIAKNSTMYVERPALASRVENWINPSDKDEHFLWICGNLGSGKSCFVSWLAIHKPEIAGLHLCRAQMPATCTYKSIYASLAYSLSIRFYDYGETLLKGFDFSLFENASSAELFKALFVDATRTIVQKEDESTVLIIDGIDELDESAQKVLCGAIDTNKDYLPSWLKIILTSRVSRQLSILLSFVHEGSVIKLCEEGLYADTMKKFISTKAPQFAKQDELIKYSAGSFIYVKCFLDEYLSSGRAMPDDLPKTMNSIYENAFRSKFPDEESFEDILPLLQVMVVARRPLDIMEYSDILEKNQREILKQLDKLGSFVVENNRRFSFYHKSLLDWLIDEHANADYYIARKDANKYISTIIDERYEEIFDSAEEDFAYFKRHGFYHLIKARKKQIISKIIERDEQKLEDAFIDTITDLAISGNFDDEKWIYETFSDSEAANIAVRRMTKRLVEYGFYGDISGILNSINNLAPWVLQYANLLDKRVKGRTTEIIAICNEDIWKTCPEHVRADILFYEGEGYREQGQMSQAQSCYSQAVNLTEEKHKTNSAYFLSLASMADVAFVNGDLEKARTLLASIETDAGILTIPSARYIISRLKGHISNAIKETEQAQKHYNDALNIARTLKKKYSIIESLNSLAEVSASSEALQYLELSLEHCGGAASENYTIETGKAYYIKAMIHNREHDYSQALSNAEQSIDLLYNKYRPGYLYACFEKGLSLFYMNRFKEAINSFDYCCEHYHIENIYPNRRIESLKYMLKSRLKLKDFSPRKDFLADIPNLQFYDYLSGTIKEVANLELSFKLFLNLFEDNNNYSIGYHNENYVLSLGEDRYVLRLPVEDFEEVDIRINDENIMLQYAAEHLDFLNAPKYIYSGEVGETTYSIHSFVNGQNLSEAVSDVTVLDNAIVMQLASNIAQMHVVSSRHPIIQKKLYYDVQSFYNFDYNFIYNLSHKWFERLKPMYKELGFPDCLSDILPYLGSQLSERTFSLCHCDIHRGNLMCENMNNILKLRFIDWELVQYTDPIYDVAVHFHKIHYSPEQEQMFLAKYCEMMGLDLDDTFNQIQVYEQLEEVKSCIIDAIRYASAIEDATQDKRNSNNEKYYFKIRALSSRFPNLVKSNHITIDFIDKSFYKYKDIVKSAITK